MHKEIPVKVTAWVDEGVADLVEALNMIPGIETLDSCENDNGTARVYFRFRKSAWETVKNTDRIAKSLGSESEAGCPFDLSLEYRGEYNPIARLATAPDSVSALAAAVRSRVLMARSA